jgi:tetratricopeptide (TPR) repeat protein
MQQSERVTSPVNEPTILLVGTGRRCDRLFSALQTLGLDVERASAEVAPAAFKAVAPDLCVITGSGDTPTNRGKGALQRLLDEQVLSGAPTVLIDEDNVGLGQRYTCRTIVKLSPTTPVFELANRILNIVDHLTDSQKSHETVTTPIYGKTAVADKRPIEAADSVDEIDDLAPPAGIRPSPVVIATKLLKKLGQLKGWWSPINLTYQRAILILRLLNRLKLALPGHSKAFDQGRLQDPHGLLKSDDTLSDITQPTSIEGRISLWISIVARRLRLAEPSPRRLSRVSLFAISAALVLLVLGSFALAISISNSTANTAAASVSASVPAVKIAMKRTPPAAAEVVTKPEQAEPETETEEPVPAVESSPKIAKTVKTAATPRPIKAKSKKAGIANRNAKQREQLQQTEKATELIAQGNKLLKQNRLGMAESFYLKALQAKPNYPKAIASIVRVHLQRKDGTEAFRWAKRLNQIQPKNAANKRLLVEASKLKDGKSATPKK